MSLESQVQIADMLDAMDKAMEKAVKEEQTIFQVINHLRMILDGTEKAVLDRKPSLLEERIRGNRP